MTDYSASWLSGIRTASAPVQHARHPEARSPLQMIHTVFKGMMQCFCEESRRIWELEV